MAVIALVWANGPLARYYGRLVDAPLSLAVGAFAARFTPKSLVNDGLMAIFFLVVGLEMKRELVVGELRTAARALLPAIAALGGMMVPAGLFWALNHDGPGRNGWGIPMATDIAFAIGCLSLLRSRVPDALVVFVTALAIFDDLGGILVIAIFYGHIAPHDALPWLIAFGVVFALGVLLGRVQVHNAGVYALVGAALWYTLHRAGVHPTMAGVALGMVVPAMPRRDSREVLGELTETANVLALRPPEEELAEAELAALQRGLEDLEPPLDRIVRVLHPWVAWFVMPAFALVNAGIDLRTVGLQALASAVTLGVGLGLLLGKQVGVFLATLAAVKLGLAPMPGEASQGKLYGVSVVAGIGFTVALFIANLAYEGHPSLLDEAKLGILIGSALSAVLGLVALRATPEV